MPLGWITALSLSVLIVSNAMSARLAYNQGRDRAEARHAAAVDRLNRELSEVTSAAITAEAARIRAERERNELLSELDALGDAETGADDIALPAGSVSRINAIGR